MISSHGTFVGIRKRMPDGTEIKFNMEPIFGVREPLTNEKYHETYYDDVVNKRLHYLMANIQGVTIQFFALTPDFFDFYLKSLPDSLVFLDSCESLHNHIMADVLARKGAKAVLGYDGNASYIYSSHIGKTFMQEMIDGKDSVEAFKKTLTKYEICKQ